MMQENSKRVPHYGLRKLSVGVASVLLGATLYLGGSTVAHADPVTANASQTSTTAATTKTVSSPTSLASTNQVALSSANQAATSTAQTSESTASTATKSAASTASAAQSNAISATSSTAVKSSSASPASSTASKSATAKSNSAATEPASSTANTVKGTYSMTTDVADYQIKAGVNAPMMTVGIKAGTQPGDVITIAGDEGTAYKLSISKVNPDWGTIVESEKNGQLTATITFKTAGSGWIYFELVPTTNYDQQNTVITDLLDTNKVFTLAYNGKVQQSVTLKQSIHPTWDPSFSRFDADANKYVFPGRTVKYTFKVNEVDGIDSAEYDPTNSPSNQVNSAVNYGTVITIPMPTGFVLDEDATKSANKFTDQTTITQQGNNIIINVPKGSGAQNYQQADQGDQPYTIIGHYNFAQNADNPVHTASAPITMVQKLNDNGSQTLTWTSPSPVTENYAGSMVKISVSVEGEVAGGWSSKLLPQDNQEYIVNYFDFGNDSDINFTNGTAHLTLTFPDGLNVDRIKTPTMNGTKSYKYTITLADGTTETGTVTAGQSVTVNNGSIKQIEFTPDTLLAGSRTGVPPVNYMKDGTQADANVFEAYGKVADKYSNGEAVKNGDALKTSMQFTTTADYKVSLTGGSNFDVTQQVVTPAEQKFTFLPYSTTQHQTSGTKDAFLIGTSGSYNAQINHIDSPIFYVVLPAGATFDQTAKPILTLGKALVANAQPRISYFMVGDQEVAKIDLSDYALNGGDTQYFQLEVNSGANMLNGTYYSEIYVVSPKAKISIDATQQGANHVALNPAWVEGNTDDVYWIGQEQYVVNEANATTSTGIAKGNNNAIADKNGSSLDSGSKQMTYEVALRNGTDNNLSNAQFVINLPQASDSSFHFQLNGGVDLSGLSADQLNGVTVKYSNQTADLTNLSKNNGDKFNEAGYVTADQINSIGGWAAVKSIVIDAPHVKAQSIFGNIALNGQDENVTDDAGKTGTVSTAIFADDLYPYSNLNTASITVQHDNSRTPLPDGTKTVTRTINVTNPDGQQSQTVQSFTSVRHGYTQDGTEHWDAWSQGTWAEFDVPAIAGYTPSQATVAAQTVDGNTKDTVVNITYTANQQSGQIRYVVEKTGQVIATTKLSGKAGDVIAIHPVIPDGYIEDDGQTIPATVTATTDGIPTVTIYVTPKQTDKQQPADYSQESLLLIRYQTADGTVVDEATVAGNAGETKTLTFTIPTGYHAVSALPSTSYTFTGHDEPMIIVVAQDTPAPQPSQNTQPSNSQQPTEPVQPTNQPTQPSNSQQPTEPVQPTNQPTQPSNSQQPTQPKGQSSENNDQPTEPVPPTQPTDIQPVTPVTPNQPVQPKGQTTDGQAKPAENQQQTITDSATVENQPTNQQVTKAGNQTTKATAQPTTANKLPQTGNVANNRVLAILGLAGVMASLVLGFGKKRHGNN